MPIESVAAYVNNALSFIIFALVCSLLFLFVFLISSALQKKIAGRNPEIPGMITDDGNHSKSFKGADPFRKRKSAILGMSFILIFLAIILILASLYFSLNTAMAISVFIMVLILTVMAAAMIYIFKSGVFDR